ncbi:unnamed protein product [Mesocestoides corti]|uniref:Uncharacterized protein n=1 Tax=Mesocestoides corti TaxID=53468 RepID=A0A0R3U8K3_MESCO|nr:unnamed protein product [Mesocestoides corti]
MGVRARPNQPPTGLARPAPPNSPPPPPLYLAYVNQDRKGWTDKADITTVYAPVAAPACPTRMGVAFSAPSLVLSHFDLLGVAETVITLNWGSI